MHFANLGLKYKTMDNENQEEISLDGRAHTGSATAQKPTATSAEQPGIDDTLASINKNMSTMADILQKMYTQRDSQPGSQPLRGKRPTGNKRSHADSEDSEQELGQSESEESTTLERKRLRRRYSVNPQIWGTLSQGTKRDDVHLYNLQETIIKAVFASLQTTSALVSKDLGTEHTQLLGQSIDSLAMLAHAYAQLTQLRKNQIRPALRPEYSAICSLEESRESLFLFGDDLPKVLKEAKESSNISSSIKHHSKTYKKPSWSGRRENARSQQRDFQWRGQQKAPHQQMYKKKKATKPLHEKK